MISGARVRACLLLLALLPLPAVAQWDAAHLLEALARTVPERIAYSETRRMAYLDVPLTTEGELEFRPPDWLRRSVTGSGESYVIAGETVRVEGPAGGREIALDVHPALRAFAESLRATLAGDLARLERYFIVELQGRREHWRLHLRPRDGGVASVIHSIELSGTGTTLRRIETREAGGDLTITELKAGT
jgi:hypothetical protein